MEGIAIPKEIQELIGDRIGKVDEVGKSSSKVICYSDMILKIEKTNKSSDNEYRMMEWLNGKLSVPEILCFKKEQEMSYLLMTRVEGTMSCGDDYMENPKLLIKLMAEGMRKLWSLDITDCPSMNNIDKLLKEAEYRVINGLCDIEDAEPETYGENGFRDPAELLTWLKEHKPEEEFVFTHGDCCMPNLFLNKDRFSGFIDLGNCGIADKYQDIALCYRSLLHNFAGVYTGKAYPKFDEEMFFKELGIEPDWEKIRYYILLDELF